MEAFEAEDEAASSYPLLYRIPGACVPDSDQRISADSVSRRFPNLLLILTFSFGFLHGSLPGMIYGLGAGLLMDLFYSGPFGFYSLVFVLIGYLNGFFSRFYYEEYITLPMFMCVFNLMIYHIYIYVFRFLIRLKLNLLYYGLHVVLPSIVFSLLVTLVLYRFFFSAHERIER